MNILITIFLAIGIMSVAMSILLVALYWWEDRQWRKKKETMRQMYESDVDLTEMQNHETNKEND